MKFKIAIVLIILLLGVAPCFAQGVFCRASVGGVLPLRRTFAALEVSKKIAPRYAISIVGEVSATESNVMPKLAFGITPRLSCEAGFGWGHHWKKADCNDHNYHTYILGVMWSKPISGRVSFFAGPSMFWRSYQAHIGLHRGTLRINIGFVYRL